MKTPSTRYSICTISTNDHKKWGLAKEVYEKARSAGWTQEDIYFKGIEAVQAQLNKGDA